MGIPCSPAIRTSHFHCLGHGFNPWLVDQHLIIWHSQKVCFRNVKMIQYFKTLIQINQSEEKNSIISLFAGKAWNSITLGKKKKKHINWIDRYFVNKILTTAVQKPASHFINIGSIPTEVRNKKKMSNIRTVFLIFLKL